MRKLTLIAILVSLSACQQTVDTNIASSGTGLNGVGTVGVGDTGSAIDPNLVDKVTDKLAQLGYRIGEAQPFYLDIAVSEGPTAATIVDASGQAARKVVKKTPRPWFRKCTPTLYRFSVVLTDVKDGNLVYRGEASEEHCKAGDSAVFAFLADAALADLRSPRGALVEKRVVKR